MSNTAVKISLFLLFLLNIVDAAATITLIDAGLVKEWNPIMKKALDYGVFHFLLLKFLATSAACIVFWHFRALKLAKIGLIGALIGYSLLLLHFCIGLL